MAEEKRLKYPADVLIQAKEYKRSLKAKRKVLPKKRQYFVNDPPARYGIT